MSLVAAIRGMLAKGFSVEQALDAAEAVEAANGSRTTRQARNARYYEARKERLKASETSESDGRLKASEPVLNKTPLAGVEDNLSKPTQDGKITSLHNARALSDPPTKPELDSLEVLLREAGFPAINAAAPKLCVLAPIVSLLRPGTGPPCDLQADVLPVIRGKAKSLKRESVRSWDFFAAAILEARDRRLQSTPEVQAATGHRGEPLDGNWTEAKRRVVERFDGDGTRNHG